MITLQDFEGICKMLKREYGEEMLEHFVNNVFSMLSSGELEDLEYKISHKII